MNIIFYVIWLKSLKQLRPYNTWQLSWETTIFQILQFPWIMLGVLTGLYQVITGKMTGKIKITDKGGKVKGLEIMFFLPHFIFVLINIIAIYISKPTLDIRGYYWFSFAVAFAHSLALVIGVGFTIWESLRNLPRKEWINYLTKYILTIVLTIVSFTISIFTIT